MVYQSKIFWGLRHCRFIKKVVTALLFHIDYRIYGTIFRSISDFWIFFFNSIFYLFSVIFDKNSYNWIFITKSLKALDNSNFQHNSERYSTLFFTMKILRYYEGLLKIVDFITFHKNAANIYFKILWIHYNK